MLMKLIVKMLFLYCHCCLKNLLNVGEISILEVEVFNLKWSKAFYLENLQTNGNFEYFLARKITLYPACKNYSADFAPLSPEEKFSIDLTVFFSIGTDVPPEVMQTIFFFHIKPFTKFLQIVTSF